MKVTVDAMKLGQNVILFHGAYGIGTVVKVTSEAVEVARPYLLLSEYTLGNRDSERRSFTTGVESVTLWKVSGRTYEVIGG